MRTNLGLRQLEAIVAIASLRSFSAAAVQLHISQPALSRTIRLAEESLGVRIFDRDTRAVSLTPAGEELVPIAQRVVLEFGDSMSELSQFIEGRRGRVRIAALPSMAHHFLVDAISQFAANNPKVEFQIRIELADRVLGLLESREIDIGLTVQPPPDGRFFYDHVGDDEFVLICRNDDPLAVQFAAHEALPWTVFRDRKFIAAAPGSNTRNATDTGLMESGLTIRPFVEIASSDIQTIGTMVAAGLGLTVVPATTVPCLGRSDLVVRRLFSPNLKRRIGIVTLNGRTLSVASTRFSELLSQLGRVIATRWQPELRD